MSYNLFLAQEYAPAFLALFDYVTLDGELEDVAGFRLSAPLSVGDEVFPEDFVTLRDTSIVLNESYVLVLNPNDTDAIVWASDVDFPSGDQSILFWIRPIAGEELDSLSRPIFRYGNLVVGVDSVDDVGFNLSIDVATSNMSIPLTISETGYAVFIVRTGDTFEVFIDNDSVNSVTEAGFTPGDVEVNHAPGNAEVELQALSLHDAALVEADRTDIYDMGFVGYIAREVVSGDNIEFLTEETVEIMTEWHVVGI